MYCSVCQSAFQSFYLERARKVNLHHSEYESLCQSVDNGCPACRQLLGQLPPNLRPSAADMDGLRGTDTIIYSFSSSGCWCLDIYLLYNPSWLRQLGSGGNASNRIGVSYSSVPIPANEQQTELDQDTESRRISIPGTPGVAMGESTASPETWTKIYHWLQHCLHSHLRCRANSNRPWVPSR